MNFRTSGAGRARITLAAAALLCLVGAARAQGQLAAGDVAQANNPLANFTAFNLHNYTIGELTQPDKSANQFWARFAKPFSIGQSNWLMRASLPINSYPVAPTMERQSGIGDFNIFAAYLIDTGNPALSVGVGPQVSVADKGAGWPKWQIFIGLNSQFK